MKRILFFAALVLGMVSCMKDQSFDADLAGDGNFVVSVALPDDATRAAGVDSSKGAIANNVLNEYDIRYTLEVYDANGALAKEDQKTVKETSTSFELRLIPGRHYRFVVWADFVKGDVAYYNVEDLRDVKLIGDHNAMNESRDAYTAVYNTATEGEGKEFSSASKIEMTLTRPFAKLRVVTNDMKELYAALESATVKYTTPIYTGFNALDAKVTGATESNVEKSVDFTDAAYKYDGEPTTEGEQTLFADYIFGAEGDVVMFTLDVEDAVAAIPTVTFNTNIPVQRNHLTTIYGPVLTDANNISVEIEDAFAQPDNWVFEAFVNGGVVTLDKDYEIGSTLYVEADAVLNLNGKTIKNAAGNQNTDVIVVKGNGKLTINGEGAIEAVTGNDGYAIIVRDNAELVINGGTYKSGVDANGEPNAVIYARDNGEVFVNGGTFPNDNNSKYVLNKKDANRATTTIEVRGGKFQNFNPADNAAENPGTNFCAEGYAAFDKQDGWFEVFYTGGESTINAVVNNATDLNTAMAQGGVIILAEGEFGTIVAKSNVTLVGTENAKVNAVNLNGADYVTLKNINFDAANAVPCVDGQGTYKVYANIMTGVWQEAQSKKGAHNLVIDGCAFVGSFKTGKPGSAIALTDYYRTSGLSGNVTIKNCVFETSTDFGGYDIYGHYTGDSTNGHGNFVIENNTFSSTRPNGMPVYLGRYASNIPVVVKGNAFNTVSSLDDAVYVQDHSNYGVSIDASNNTFAQ